MKEDNHINVTDEELAKAFVGDKKAKKSTKHKMDLKKKSLIFLIIGIVFVLGGGAMLVIGLLVLTQNRETLDFPDLSSKDEKQTYYSKLTGQKLSDEAAVTAPIYCMQTPNGTDGARPQAGLDKAGVVFEAIAEAGITRFAAIYQDPSSAVIGPIRSLRTYYLEWDVPFDCTIVHAGGAGDALAAISAGGYRNLDESYTYMYRGTYGGRLWNNLFTTSNYLKKFNQDNGYSKSEAKGFARMTPAESNKSRVDQTVKNKLVITEPAKGDTSKVEASVATVGIRFGGLPNFNVNYNYNADTNTYARNYQSGAAHEVYSCPDGDLGEKNPEDACALVQMTPSVIVAMVVNERKAADNYHEDIDAIGSGDVYIFQNGTAIKGTWSKPSKEDQIKFTDGEGKEIKLAPGQTFVSVVPKYGSVEF